jgi:hypothetical protein
MVPYDGRLESQMRGQQVQDITGTTLFLLMTALKTDSVAVVLDSCHSGGGTRGNLLFRSTSSRLGSGNAVPSDEELAYQQQWLERLNLTQDELQSRRRAGIAKGMAFGSTHVNQLAADAPFDGFYAGAFTYLLTRFLWQQPAAQPVESAFNHLILATQDVADAANVIQTPVLQVQPNSDVGQKPIYFLQPQTPAAEAVLRQQTTADQVELWLGGISSSSLTAFTNEAVFELVDQTGQVIGEVEQTERDGLIGKGRLRSGATRSLEPGMLLREKIRGIPANLELKIGLDDSLGSDLDTARSQLQTVGRVRPISVNQGDADYLLGRITTENSEYIQQQSHTAPPPTGSIGLFTPGLLPVLNTFGEPDEPTTAAIDRLRSRLKMLLAGRMLSSLHNGGTSNLNIDVQIQPIDSRGRRGRSWGMGSRAAQESGSVSQSVTDSAQQILTGTDVRLQIKNNERSNLYVAVFAIFSDGNIALLHPMRWEDPETATLLARNQPVTVPNNPDFHFTATSAGFFELVVLGSTAPLRDALRGLQQIARSRGIRTGDSILLEGDEPVDVLDAMLADVDRISRADVNSASRRGTVSASRGQSGASNNAAAPGSTSSDATRGVDAGKLAALAATIEIVDP